MTLADILVGRARMDADLQKIIDERTTPWGVTVQSVEIRDVIIPQGLEDAMSQQAQAERERQSRVILGEAEMQVAESFAEASKAYVDNPTALHLRAMNMLFEGLKEKGALVIVPSSAVDTMNLGGLSGMTALAQQNLPKNLTRSVRLINRCAGGRLPAHPAFKRKNVSRETFGKDVSRETKLHVFDPIHLVRHTLSVWG